METVKNLLKPGTSQEDKLLPESGRHAGLGGEGSHFVQAKNTASVNPTATEPLVASSTADSIPTAVLNSSHYEPPVASPPLQIPGSYPTEYGFTNPYNSTELDPRLGGTAQQGTTGLVSSNAGSQSSNLFSKADAQVDSDLDNPRTMGSTQTDHHYGRDAAVLGGGAAVVEGIPHHKHQAERESLTSTGNAAYTGTTPSGMGSSYYGGPSGTAVSGLQSSTATDHAPAQISHSTGNAGMHAGGASLTGLEQKQVAGDSGIGSSTEPGATENHGNPRGQNSVTDHHYGRDAAIGGAGLAGAAALGKHEQEKHEVGGRAADVANSGPAASISEPHSSDLMNKPDPRTDSMVVSDTPTTQQPTREPITTSESNHHYGRDTAVGGVGLAGAAALGKYEHDKHEADKRGANVAGATNGTAPSTSGLHSSNLMNKSDSGADSKAAVNNSIKSPAAAVGASTLSQPAATQNTFSGDKDHHYGRDAVVGGAGLAGAGALEKHEYEKHDADKKRASVAGTGPAPNTSGPHKHDWMNRLDPRVDHKAGIETSAESQSSSSGTNDHHYERDAAAVGAAGIGAHEISKHHKEKELENAERTPNVPSDSTTTSETKDHHYGRGAAGLGAAGVGAHEISKHHKEKELEKAEGTSNAPSQSTAVSDKKDHHYGRDAAGLGAAGVGAHEISKHHREKEAKKTEGTSVVPSDSITTPEKKDHHYGRDVAGLGAAGVGAHEISKHHEERELREAEGASNVPSKSTAASGHTGHHYGRDAAGLGAAGLGAHEISKHKEREPQNSQPISVTQGPEPIPRLSISDQTMKELPRGNDYGKNIEDPRYGMPQEGAPHNLAGESVGQDRGLGAKEEPRRRSRGFLSFLHRDKNKKYSKEEEDEFNRQESEYNSHKGRDPALGGAVVGSAAYEAESTIMVTKLVLQSLPAAPGNNGIGTGEGTQNALADRTRATGTHEHGQIPVTSTSQDEYYARDAGVLGVAGATAVHEHNNHGHHTSTTEGLTLGDKLRGIDRNRGLNDGEFTSTTRIPPSEHHVARDAAVGAGAVGVAEHEHHKRNVLRKDPPPGYGVASHSGTATAPGAVTDPETGLPLGETGSAAVTGRQSMEKAPAEFW